MTAVHTTDAAVPTNSSAPRRAAKGGAPRRRGSAFDRLLPYLLLAPALIAILWLVGWPVLSLLVTSFRKLNLKELTRGEVVWVGLDNYAGILGDPTFWAIAVRTVVFTAVVVGASVLAGLLIALLMRQINPVVRVVLQVAMLLAWAMPLLAATTVYQWIFDQQYGILNKTLVKLGFDGFAGYGWFSTGTSTMAVIGLLIVWQAIPFLAFSLYAGAIGIPRDQYEAAAIDGATAWQTFRSVTWPELRPLLLMLTFLSMLWDFKVFAQIWAFKKGGPDGGSTTLPVYQYLEGISKSHFGVAAAVSVVMMALLALLTFQYLRRLIKQEGAL
ncbi:N,N'-diacetylchitobiose transport system permease protein [Saccharothrix tamanrassetensis]|uniref:N,N'-diacetylchitobiose transport system permease protein n=1 Tax=Saccharothrix tamanrassetensis TaxID=1051531 RepID=A0A841CM16_9PSEU|nr:sugar ABC transporter permease [Saccharothrix tamanrassetensis]MBB5956606.1 N,N'-diacetylchitobiose transport system permease protein [Saccharothrix tamanrassetensis]